MKNMKNVLKKIYFYYAPNWVKKICRCWKHRDGYQKFMSHNEEWNYVKEIEYVKKNHFISMIPYKWAESYQEGNYKIKRDTKGFYCTVIAENQKRKLYLPEQGGIDDGFYSAMMAWLMREQDSRSPHLYFKNKVQVKPQSVMFDIGAAEGLITLMNIDKLKKAYLFECDEKWIEALKKTFEPWCDKVTIINKLVSSVNDEKNTTLEPFLVNHLADSCIVKMDIEGMETEVIKYGLGKYMGCSNIMFSCCTYHNADDASILQDIFERTGYCTEFSDGYMIILNENPYFRKGVIRAWK